MSRWDAARAASNRPLRKYKPVGPVGERAETLEFKSLCMQPGATAVHCGDHISACHDCGYHVCSCKPAVHEPKAGDPVSCTYAALTLRAQKDGLAAEKRFYAELDRWANGRWGPP